MRISQRVSRAFCNRSAGPMSEIGHFRQIDPLPTLAMSASLRSLPKLGAAAKSARLTRSAMVPFRELAKVM
jgi:hypothetical protein